MPCPMGGVSLSLLARLAPFLVPFPFPFPFLSFLVGFLPCIPGLWEHSEQVKTAQNRLKRGKNKEFFEVLWCFLGNLRYPKRAKPKIFLNLRGKRWANWAAFLVALGACLGAAWGFLGASALIVRHPCKLGLLGYPCAIAFPRCFNKSVLKAF